MKISIKDLPKDRVVSVEDHNGSTVINIPNGRIRLMPKGKPHKVGYSARRGGRKTTYKSSCYHMNYGVPKHLTNKNGLTVSLQPSEYGLSHKESMQILYRKMDAVAKIGRKK